MKEKRKMQSLAFASMMVAINIIIIFLSSYQTFSLLSDLLLVLFIPLCSAITCIYSNKKMAFCYAFSSILICFFIQFEKTLFYLFPGIISGLLFAYFIEKKWNYIYSIFVVTLVEATLSAFLYFLFEQIFHFSIYTAFQTLFHLNEAQAKQFFPLFLCFSSLAQTILCAYILAKEAEKFQIYVHMNDEPALLYFYISLFLSLTSGITMFFQKEIASFTLGISIFSIFLTFYYMLKRKRYVLFVSTILFLIFGFAIFSTFLPNYGIYPLSYFIFLFDILGIFLYQKEHAFKA